ncbi:MAG: MarR family transcriptional regulator [Candidatus Heimdallarchaeota archaeon]|nr:MarR family transcriptional regulator [Candidatus Heimdallarchaeota archaeon]
MSFSLSSFDSDEITCFDIIKAFHALTDNELEVLSCVHQGQPIDIKGITDVIPKDRATISRSIKKLQAIGFVRSDKVTLERGGYKFVYSSLSMSEIREKLKQNIEQISKRMIKAVSKLTEEKCIEMYKNVLLKYKT